MWYKSKRWFSNCDGRYYATVAISKHQLFCNPASAHAQQKASAEIKLDKLIVGIKAIAFYFW